MRVDLSSGDDSRPHTLRDTPRFARAASRLRALNGLSFVAGLCGLAGAGAVWGWPAIRDTPVQALLAGMSAGALAFAAAALDARRIASWRRDALQRVADGDPPALAADAPRRPRWRRALHAGTRRMLAWLQTDAALALAVIALCCIGIAAVARGWNLTLPALALPPPLGPAAGGIALALLFGLLVVERWLAAAPPAEWPEAARLARFARVAMTLLAVAAVCLFAARGNSAWPSRLAVVAGLLPAAVALEQALRALLSLFVRRAPTLEPQLIADSFVAHQLQWPPRPLHNLHEELHSRFGIDLKQNWAFGYVKRALLPVAGGVLAIAWLLSGLRQIPIDGRGIYERFGQPVAVLGPGLHAGLPWPFSRLRPVENGVIHSLSAIVDDDGEESDIGTAEGPAPASANRLWDSSHVNEKSQVIAGLAGGRQSFQVMSMDVRFVYRIGLSDAAALAATYHSADIPALIRSTAGRVLVEDFASRTLDRLLSEQREELARAIGARVQRDLDALDSGVEILATLIEQIHPPAGAANAYHSLQAAQIRAQAAVARERGRREEEINAAQLEAAMALDKAAAGAREATAQAEAAQLRFAAEQDAYRSAGRAFVLEQYLGQLAQGLKEAQLMVLDHRIGGGAAAPTIDLRTYAPKGDGATP